MDSLASLASVGHLVPLAFQAEQVSVARWGQMVRRAGTVQRDRPETLALRVLLVRPAPMALRAHQAQKVHLEMLVLRVQRARVARRVRLGARVSMVPQVCLALLGQQGLMARWVAQGQMACQGRRAAKVRKDCQAQQGPRAHQANRDHLGRLDRLAQQAFLALQESTVPMGRLAAGGSQVLLGMTVLMVSKGQKGHQAPLDLAARSVYRGHLDLLETRMRLKKRWLGQLVLPLASRISPLRSPYAKSI